MKITKAFVTYSLTIIISLLLLSYYFLNKRNSGIIDKNIEIKKQAETIKVKTGDIIRSLHLMDLGIRGYALLPNQNHLNTYDSALYYLDHTFVFLEHALQDQQFPMESFDTLKDSVYAYVDLGAVMLQNLQEGKREGFMQIYQHDYGYNTWLQYLKFSDQVNQFENNIFESADRDYKKALSRNTTIFVVILALVLPTLMYSVYHANQTYSVSERLRISEEQKNEILSSQNITLEKLVKERTEEIETQNEEIIAQNEELSEANLIIEEQNSIIKDQNKYLQEEIDKQTQNLLKANAELIQRIAKMEQFAFIVSHNLRAPVAQILGLSSILKHSKDPQEAEEMMSYVARSSKRLDTVLKDLNHILIVENEPDQQTSLVDLSVCIEETLHTLSQEVNTTHAKVSQSLEIQVIESVPTYIYSIFYNLLSNAIKYGNPAKDLEIRIHASRKEDKVNISITDNGLGIDMEKYSKDIFSLYRRFHTHVEGRGLGLYLTKVQVEILGGSISIESKPHQGTTFFITLPAKKG